MNRRTMVATAVAGGVLVLAGGGAAYHYSRRAAERAAVLPAVKLSSAYALTTMQMVVTGDASYAEAFGKVDLALGEIDKATVQLRSTVDNVEGEFAKAAIDYMQSCQATIRSLGQMLRKSLARSSAMERTRDLESALGKSQYMREYLVGQADKTIAEARKAINEEVEALQVAKKNLVALVALQPTVKSAFGDAAVIDPAMLSSITALIDKRLEK